MSNRLRDVGAGDEEHESDSGEEHEQGQPNITDNDVLVGPHDRCQPSRGARRSLGLEPRGQTTELARGLLNRRARAQPRDQVDQRREVRVDDGRRQRRHADPRLGAARVLESGRHHADDREPPLPQGQRTSDDVARSAVASLPEPVTDGDHVLRADHVVSTIQRASQKRLDTEHSEEIPRDGGALHKRRRALLDDDPRLCPVVVDARSTLEEVALFADPVDLGDAKRIMGEARRAQLLPGDQQPILLMHR